MKNPFAGRVFGTFLESLGAVCIAGLTLTAAAVIPPAEKLLPADTMLVISIPDFAKSRDIYNKSPQGRLLADPAMKPFCDKFKSKFKEEFLSPLERELGVKLDEYCELAQGQLTFAITQEGWNGQGKQEPAVLLLLDTRDRSGQLKTNLTALRKKWIESGKTVRAEKIRAVEFMVVPVSTNDMPKTFREFFPQRQQVQQLGQETPKSDGKADIYIGQFESLLIVGDSAKAIEKVVAHLTGGSAPALADETLFEADRLAFFRDAPFYGWFNAKRFFDVLINMPPEAPNPDASPFAPQFDTGKILTALGLGGLKTIAFNWRSSEAGFLGEMFIGVPDSTRQGIFKILATGAKDSSPPAFVPADALKFRRYRIDGPQALATIEKILNDINPQFGNMFNFSLDTAGAAQKEKDPSFDLKKSLVSNLGDDFIVFSRNRRGAMGQDAPVLFLIGSPSPEKLAGLIKVMSSISPFSTVTERDFVGRKVYSIGSSARRSGRTNSTPTTTSFAATGSYVALSTDTALLEEYLRSSDNQSKPLRELPGLTDAAQKVGGLSTGLFTYENGVETMRAAFEKLRTMPKKDTNTPSNFNPLVSSLPFAQPAKSFEGLLDFSLLPEFNRVSKYFSFTILASSTTANGICLRGFSPTPPGLK